MMKFQKNIFLSISTCFLLASSYATDYLVKVKPGTRNKLARSLNATDSFKTGFGEFIVVSKNRNNDSILSRSTDIFYYEENIIIGIDPIENELDAFYNIEDELYGKQWALKNDGKNGGGYITPGVAGADINAEMAWTITTGSKTVKVAVLDTGIAFDHPDLVNNMWTNELEANGVEGVDDDGNGYIDDIHGYDIKNDDGSPWDGNGHGTHCAGIIGASHNNFGTAGVMKNVELIAVKFLGNNGSGLLADSIKAVDYAVKVGADILSNSYGSDPYSQAMFDAIEYANSLGIPFVVSAGNDSESLDFNPDYPASYELPNIISVGSTTGWETKSNFSNWGISSVHVMAPGSKILSTWPFNQYRDLSGTSMAAPYVAGMLGLLKTMEPSLSAQEMKQRLIETSVFVKSMEVSSTSKGRVDAYRMLANITD